MNRTVLDISLLRDKENNSYFCIINDFTKIKNSCKIHQKIESDNRLFVEFSERRNDAVGFVNAADFWLVLADVRSFFGDIAQFLSDNRHRNVFATRTACPHMPRHPHVRICRRAPASSANRVSRLHPGLLSPCCNTEPLRVRNPTLYS